MASTQQNIVTTALTTTALFLASLPTIVRPPAAEAREPNSASTAPSAGEKYRIDTASGDLQTIYDNANHPIASVVPDPQSAFGKTLVPVDGSPKVSDEVLGFYLRQQMKGGSQIAANTTTIPTFGGASRQATATVTEVSTTTTRGPQRQEQPLQQTPAMNAVSTAGDEITVPLSDGQTTVHFVKKNGHDGIIIDTKFLGAPATYEVIHRGGSFAGTIQNSYSTSPHSMFGGGSEVYRSVGGVRRQLFDTSRGFRGQGANDEMTNVRAEVTEAFKIALPVHPELSSNEVMRDFNKSPLGREASLR